MAKCFNCGNELLSSKNNLCNLCVSKNPGLAGYHRVNDVFLKEDCNHELIDIENKAISGFICVHCGKLYKKYKGEINNGE